MSPVLTRLCSVLAVVASLAMAGLLALVAGFAALTALAVLPDALGEIAGRAPEAGPLTPAQRWALVGLTGIAIAPGLFALWHMRALFLSYAAGQVFTDACARHIRRIGLFLVIGVLVALVVGAAASAVLSYDAATGGGSLSLDLGSHDIMLALIGALLIVIGAAMGEAARLAAENRSII